MELDETDKEILNGLIKNGRISYRELAERTGVTPPTVKTRIDQLKEDGVIQGFTVQIDEEKVVQEPVLNVIISLEVDPSAVDDVYSTMARSGAQYVMKTADSRILAHFKGTKERFESHVVENMSDGVTGYSTTMITDEESQPPKL